MVSLRGGSGFSKRATIVPIAVLAAMLQALLLFSAVGVGHAHDARAGFAAASLDCGAPTHRDEAPACPLHPQCCVAGFVAFSFLASVASFVSLPVSAGEETLLAVAAAPGLRGPEPAPPWSSRAPPSLG